ncbi:MAG: bacteriorhodopsin [Halobaculum sp.]
MSGHTALTSGLTYTIGTAALLVGTLVTAVAWYLDEQETAPYDTAGYAMLLGITGLATLAYAGMANDLFTIRTGGIEVETLRYVDWAVTTPLLVGYMAHAAMASRRVVLGVIVADLLMIALGFVGVLQTGTLVWLFGGLSTLAYLVLVYLLYGPLSRQARERGGAEQWALYTKLRNLIGVLWFVYPVVWALSPPGLGLLTVDTTAVVITYLDVSAKLGFVLITTNTAGVFDGIIARTSGSAGSNPGHPDGD